MLKSVFAGDADTLLITREVWGKTLAVHFEALGFLADTFATRFGLLADGMAVLWMGVLMIAGRVVIDGVVVVIMIMAIILLVQIWFLLIGSI